MRYPRFRRLHLFVGSGVIEAGCKTVIASRFKQSGTFWTVRGANDIIALRCSFLNGRFEDYWAIAGPPDLHFHVAHRWQGRDTACALFAPVSFAALMAHPPAVQATGLRVKCMKPI